jgi:hypothetical protein
MINKSAVEMAEALNKGEITSVELMDRFVPFFMLIRREL